MCGSSSVFEVAKLVDYVQGVKVSIARKLLQRRLYYGSAEISCLGSVAVEEGGNGSSCFLISSSSFLGSIVIDLPILVGCKDVILFLR